LPNRREEIGEKKKKRGRLWRREGGGFDCSCLALVVEREAMDATSRKEQKKKKRLNVLWSKCEFAAHVTS
jgi:hypothetical protein